MGQSAASVIFAEGEIGHAEMFAGVSPDGDAGSCKRPGSSEFRDRLPDDHSSSTAVLALK